MAPRLALSTAQLIYVMLKSDEQLTVPQITSAVICRRKALYSTPSLQTTVWMCNDVRE
jgi:hypothetical protein